MTKIKYFVVLLLFVFVKQARTQIIAGDSISSGVYYQRLDTLVLLPGHACYNIDKSIDLTNDGVADLKFVYGNCASPSFGEEHHYLYILNQNIEIAETQSNILWPINNLTGNLINSNFNWTDTIVRLTLRAYSTGGSSAGVFTGSSNFLGFRIKNANDTIYGWVNIGVTGANGLFGTWIKSYAKGVSTIGVNEIEGREMALELFPMPAKDVLFVKNTSVICSQEEIPVICDISGKQYSIPIQYINNNMHKLDVSSLNAGMYFIIVKSEKGCISTKVIVQ